MKYLLLFILSLVIGINVFATLQVPDSLLYNGKKYKMHSYLLDSYFKKYPNKRPQTEVKSTGLHRGYLATFEIRDCQLFVKDIQILELTKQNGRVETKWKSVLKEVFPGKKQVEADWFTGLLTLPYGEIMDSVYSPFGSVYENYFLFEIDNGTVKREKEFNYKEYEHFKEKQYESFKKTTAYAEIKTELIKSWISETALDSYFKYSITQYISKILAE